VARLTALSIENGRLYQRAQDALLRVRNQAADIRQMNADLEQRVAERTLQLEAANREMSVVNYTVSHDLRAPLRALQGFSQMLLDDFADEMPAGALEYVEKLRTSAGELNLLLDGLLDFCKVSSHQLKKEAIDLNDIARQSVDMLRSRMQGRRVEVRIGKLGSVYGDRLLVRQVFVNLISNALTYTSTRDPAILELGRSAQDNPTEPVFYVKDNGVGFDPSDAPKLFKPFRRLHSDSAFEGTGVGLSIVAGIVQRHGGRAWATGVADGGATFYFTLGVQEIESERVAS
jgi:signal transduction histidine kinase